MTLIVSIATQHYLVQVGDTRLTVPSPDGQVRLEDDHQNKLTYFDGRAAFGYTGLARINGEETADWIGASLAGQYPSYGLAPLSRLRDRATAVFRTIHFSAEDKRLAIVGVGWQLDDRRTAPRPAIWRVSNFHDRSGRPLLRAEVEFTIDSWTPQLVRGVHRIAFTGREPSKEDRDAFASLIRRKLKQHRQRAEIVLEAVNFIRRCAATDPAVGENLVSIYIPSKPSKTVIRVPQGAQTAMGVVMTGTMGGEFTAVAGGDFSDTVCFHYWPKESNTPKALTPGIAGVFYLNPTTHIPAHIDGSIPPIPHKPSLRPIRLALVPPKVLFGAGERFRVKCKLTGLPPQDLPLLSSYKLVILWDHRHVAYERIEFGTSLGGKANAAQHSESFPPGKFNPDDPNFAALVFSERSHLPAEQLIKSQLRESAIASVWFRALSASPTRLNLGFPDGSSSLLDTDGIASFSASCSALLLNERHR